MEYKDYYKIMGLKRDASQADVKRAHRKLARKFHPDVSHEPNAEEKFKEVGEAYEVLKDPEKRAAYDRLDPTTSDRQEFHPPPGWDAGFEFRGGGYTDSTRAGFSDFFEELFGHQGFRPQHGFDQQYNARGEDSYAKVMVDLEDAFSGGTRVITLQSPVPDSHGDIHVVNRVLNVKIPLGIRDGQQMRLKGQGAPGLGQGTKGDLYLEIHFNPHPIYRPEGSDLHVLLPVAPWEAALGATVKMPTPQGVVDLKIPAKSTSGKRLRLKGRGIPSKPPGDIYVTLSMVTPPAQTDAERALYEKMKQTFTFNPRAAMGV